MSQFEKLIFSILNGKSDHNIRFSDLCGVLTKLGFEKRINGSHHIFVKEGIVEIINLQTRKDGLAKDYQVEQVRKLIIKYGL